MSWQALSWHLSMSWHLPLSRQEHRKIGILRNLFVAECFRLDLYLYRLLLHALLSHSVISKTMASTLQQALSGVPQSNHGQHSSAGASAVAAQGVCCRGAPSMRNAGSHMEANEQAVPAGADIDNLV